MMKNWFSKKPKEEVAPPEKEKVCDVAKHIVSLFENGCVDNEFAGELSYKPVFKFNKLTVSFPNGILEKPYFTNHNCVALVQLNCMNYTEKEEIRKAAKALWHRNSQNAWKEAIRSTGF